MNAAICVSNLATSELLIGLIERYQKEHGIQIPLEIFEDESQLTKNFMGGVYDVLFFNAKAATRIMEEIREKDSRIRLVYLAPPGAEVEQVEKELWYCLPEPLNALFLFPLLDRILSDTYQGDEMGIMLKSRGVIIHLSFSQIEYVEVMGRTVFFHLENGETAEVSGTLSDFEGRMLQWPDFIKVHRAYIVNIRHIRKLSTDGVITRSGHAVPVSRHLFSQFRKDYLCQMMDPSIEYDLEETRPVSEVKPLLKVLNEEKPTQYTVLLADDEESERQRWSKVLMENDCTVRTAGNAAVALQLAEQGSFDCVILDVKMGADNGFDCCAKIRQKTKAPIIFLSSLTDSESQSQGFVTGGVDYITKDTSAALFWLKVQTRIKMATELQQEIVTGRLRLDLKGRVAYLNRQRLLLTAVEFDLLCLLVQNPDTIYSPTRLYELIWGGSQTDSGHTVQLHLSQLRRKLDAAYPHHDYMETVWGKGYRFVPENRGEGR